MTSIFALLAVALGWFLNELSSVVRLRREDRRASGPVLTSLLEIRHRLLNFDELMRELGKHLRIPSQVRLQLQQYLRTLIPEPPKLIEEYEKAVSTLAFVDPVRAFRLRGQPLIEPYLATVQGLAATTETDAEMWSAIIEPEILGRFRANIERLILEVARAHSWVTWWRVRRRLREPNVSDDDRKMISDLIEKLKKAAESTKPA